jgi:hypothetical protein
VELARLRLIISAQSCAIQLLRAINESHRMTALADQSLGNG